jgi:cell division protein ZapA
MANKNTVEVVIDGKIYELSGVESESYLHEVAGYLNAKIVAFKREFRNYSKMDDEIKGLLMQINICDDLFLQQEKTRKAQREMEEQEREAYAAKHDLINVQMKLEATLKQLEETQKKLAELEAGKRAQEAREQALSEARLEVKEDAVSSRTPEGSKDHAGKR